MNQVARSMAQETWDKMQETRASLAFVEAFIAETQPVARDDAENTVQAAQIVERAAEPRVELSTDMLRRLIARVECLA